MCGTKATKNDDTAENDEAAAQVIKSVAHMLHEAREESVKSAEWSQVDRSGSYDDPLFWKDVSTLMICAMKMSANLTLVFCYRRHLKPN